MSDVGVYFHIPFCERVCPYCDFAVVPRPTLSLGEETRYLDALIRELRQRAGDFAGARVATVYFGGGTPSLLRPESVARLLDAVGRHFPGQPREVTLEVNPSTLERERLPAFRARGVNRLSIGVQSFDDTTLRRLGRAHRRDACDATLRAARDAGFDNVSLDLIFGAPGQTLTSLECDLNRALAFAPEHISAYTLTIEGDTPFARAAPRGKLALPDEETGYAMLETVWETLERAGYRHYELSNFARPGFASLHNRRYWERRPVLALGVGASSFDPNGSSAPYGRRPENPRLLEEYFRRVEDNGHAEKSSPALSRDEAMREAVFLALRTDRGLDLRAFRREFNTDAGSLLRARLVALQAAELVAVTLGRHLKLTPSGRRIADSVLLELL